MKEQIVSGWNVVMDNRRNPVSNLDLASQRHFRQILAWMWSMVFSLTFLAIFSFGLTWLAHLLVLGGVAMTVAVFREAHNQSVAVPVPAEHFSQASKCVWKLDSEA